MECQACKMLVSMAAQGLHGVILTWIIQQQR